MKVDRPRASDGGKEEAVLIERGYGKLCNIRGEGESKRLKMGGV